MPEDISIAGFDDLIYARLARPKLTTMSQNIAKKARMAVEALLYLQDARKNKKTIDISEERWRLPVRLVERESVKKLDNIYLCIFYKNTGRLYALSWLCA